MRYELHWKCVPLNAIAYHENWYDPYLGQGVYMLVVATTDGQYVAYYVGESDDIGRRWREHLNKWFLNPDEKYWIAESADDFLANPVRVFNENRTAQRLANRVETQKQILDQTWFCFSEVNCLRPWHTLEDIEYVLQRGVMQHFQITEDGHIGDTGRGKPRGALEIGNHFGRSFLDATLPSTIHFDDDDKMTIE